MKKKLIASILCLAMVLAIVTPAVFANEEEGVKAPSEENGTPVVENTEVPAQGEPAGDEAPVAGEPEGSNAPAESGEPEGGATAADGATAPAATPAEGEPTPAPEAPAEGDGQQTPAETPVEGGGTAADDSTAGDAAHTDAPVENPTEAPVADPETTSECTCGAENGEHREGCPLYVELTLYEKLMKTETKEEFDEIIEAYMEETGVEEIVFTCEEFDNLNAHYIFLTTGEYPSYEPEVDTVLEIVNFTKVAPLVDADK